MASLTASPQPAPLPVHSGGPTTIRIEPPCSLFELRLREVWAYRDVRSVIPFVITFWMFASPVAYASSLVPARWRWLYGLNPMAGVIDGIRWAITGRGQAPGLLLLASACAVALVFLGGLFFFNRMEISVADRV